MDEKALHKLLTQVRSGKVPIAAALAKLRDLPFVELGFATLDTHRSLRFGFPEVVLGEAKSVEQLTGIIEELRARKQGVLVPRVSAEKAKELLLRFPQASYDPVARIFQIRFRRFKAGTVAGVTPGASGCPGARAAGARR